MSAGARVEFWVYDGRANPHAGTDCAVLCEACATLAEARRRAPEYGAGNNIWRVEIDAAGRVQSESYVETVG